MNEIKKGKMNKFKSKKYSDISLDELVTYCVYMIQKEGKESTFENIVAKCYELFPDKFSLVGYPHWPDSARVNKSWLRCRTDKGWIKGTVKGGFYLTELGENIIERVKTRLKHGDIHRRIIKSKKARDRYESIVLYIKESPEYNKFLENKNYNLSISELKSFLKGTLETPKRILIQHLHLFFDAANTYNEKDIIRFLDHCKNDLKSFKE